MNQQKIRFGKAGDKVTATAGTGFYSKIDPDIAKLHFEIGEFQAGQGLKLPKILQIHQHDPLKG